jgi:PAS domain S-box-containing protein
MDRSGWFILGVPLIALLITQPPIYFLYLRYVEEHRRDLIAWLQAAVEPAETLVARQTGSPVSEAVIAQAIEHGLLRSVEGSDHKVSVVSVPLGTPIQTERTSAITAVSHSRILNRTFVAWIDEAEVKRPYFQVAVLVGLLVFLCGYAAVLMVARRGDSLLRELGAKKAWFEAFFDFSNEGIALFQNDRIVAVNDEACRITGYERGRMVGRSPLEFLGSATEQGEDGEVGVLKAHCESALSGFPQRFDLRFCRADGTDGVLEVALRKCFLPGQGEVLYGSLRDATERVKAQRGLELFRGLVDSSPLPLLVSRPDGGFYFCNQAALSLADCDRPRLMDTGLTTLFWQPGSATPAWPVIQENLHRHGRIAVSLELETAQGLRIPVEVIGHQIRHHQQSLFGLFAVDLRERINLQQQLLQSQKLEAVGQLAGGIAHDFNNLLTVILGSTELVLEESSLRRARPFIVSIRDAAERAAALTRQLLAFSRKQRVCPQIIEVNEAVRRTEKLLRRLLGENIRLEIQPADRPLRTKIDPSQFDQIILNLCVNSRDAMPDGGLLRIGVRGGVQLDAGGNDGAPHPPGGYVELTVQDSGHGMDAQTLQRIFEPFFTTKGRENGTGLGLSTVYGIVKQAEGEIRVESELGKGTKFHLYFPEYATADGEPQQEGEPAVGLSRPSTVLLVEDDEYVRTLVAEMLTRSGYSVFVAQGPDEARQIAERHGLAIDVLLSDVVLSAADGPSLVAELRRNCPRASILFISGYPDTVIGRQKSSLSGGEAEELLLLRKPFSRRELDLAIRKALGANRLPGEMETARSGVPPESEESVEGCAWNPFCGEAGRHCKVCPHFTPTV